jgi:hypothetical protein
MWFVKQKLSIDNINFQEHLDADIRTNRFTYAKDVSNRFMLSALNGTAWTESEANSNG